MAATLGVSEDAFKTNGAFDAVKMDAAIKNALVNADKEDGVHQSHVDNVYKAVAGALGVSEDAFKTNGAFDSGKIDGAIKTALEAAKNEDGIHQSHVDEVYKSVAEIFSSLGISEDMLKDKNGKFTTSKLSSTLKPVVSEAVENANKCIVTEPVI